ncbi:Cell growth regulator with RING finger domain protein 1 [Amphibalanus amphitrite]|uniref:Cell growth regulator with RING finger domain protein 1 n=1 Tax=Amphibalanus amphitrite TaxID=1232801 RepID=A0A6A4W759_AMPAM|nr:Cell growth regulator with RING finger domain protein 1 [Amphibalanus amphitrite]
MPLARSCLAPDYSFYCNAMNILIFSLVETPHFIIVLAIMIGLTLLSMYLFRGQTMFSQSVVWWGTQDAVRLHLEPLHVPFSLDVLSDAPTTEPADGTAARPPAVRCVLKTEKPCRLRLLWRVPFSALSHLLNRITAGDALLYGCQTTSAITRRSVKLCFPGDRQVALVAVIHIRDRVVSMETSVLHRYVRQADGRVTLLQPLYSSGVEDPPEDPGPAPPSGRPQSPPGSLGVCCVCRSEPAEVVLLPCRHGCVCSDCFRRTETCPLCRGRVAQYFTVPTVGQEGERGRLVEERGGPVEERGHSEDPVDAQ